MAPHVAAAQEYGTGLPVTNGGDSKKQMLLIISRNEDRPELESKILAAAFRQSVERGDIDGSRLAHRELVGLLAKKAKTAKNGGGQETERVYASDNVRSMDLRNLILSQKNKVEASASDKAKTPSVEAAANNSESISVSEPASSLAETILGAEFGSLSDELGLNSVVPEPEWESKAEEEEAPGIVLSTPIFREQFVKRRNKDKTEVDPVDKRKKRGNRTTKGRKTGEFEPGDEAVAEQKSGDEVLLSTEAMLRSFEAALGTADGNLSAAVSAELNALSGQTLPDAATLDFSAPSSSEPAVDAVQALPEPVIDASAASGSQLEAANSHPEAPAASSEEAASVSELDEPIPAFLQSGYSGTVKPTVQAEEPAAQIEGFTQVEAVENFEAQSDQPDSPDQSEAQESQDVPFVPPVAEPEFPIAQSEHNAEVSLEFEPSALESAGSHVVEPAALESAESHVVEPTVTLPAVFMSLENEPPVVQHEPPSVEPAAEQPLAHAEPAAAQIEPPAAQADFSQITASAPQSAEPNVFHSPELNEPIPAFLLGGFKNSPPVSSYEISDDEFMIDSVPDTSSGNSKLSFGSNANKSAPNRGQFPFAPSVIPSAEPQDISEDSAATLSDVPAVPRVEQADIIGDSATTVSEVPAFQSLELNWNEPQASKPTAPPVEPPAQNVSPRSTLKNLRALSRVEPPEGMENSYITPTGAPSSSHALPQDAGAHNPGATLKNVPAVSRGDTQAGNNIGGHSDLYNVPAVEPGSAGGATLRNIPVRRVQHEASADVSPADSGLNAGSHAQSAGAHELNPGATLRNIPRVPHVDAHDVVADSAATQQDLPAAPDPRATMKEIPSLSRHLAAQAEAERAQAEAERARAEAAANASHFAAASDATISGAAQAFEQGPSAEIDFSADASMTASQLNADIAASEQYIDEASQQAAEVSPSELAADIASSQLHDVALEAEFAAEAPPMAPDYLDFGPDSSSEGYADIDFGEFDDGSQSEYTATSIASMLAQREPPNPEAEGFYPWISAEPTDPFFLLHVCYLRAVRRILIRQYGGDKSKVLNPPEFKRQLRNMGIAFNILSEPNTRLDYDLRQLGLREPEAVSSLKIPADARLPDAGGKVKIAFSELLILCRIFDSEQMLAIVNAARLLSEQQFWGYLADSNLLTEVELDSIKSGFQLVCNGLISIVQFEQAYVYVRANQQQLIEICLAAGWLRLDELQEFADQAQELPEAPKFFEAKVSSEQEKPTAAAAASSGSMPTYMDWGDQDDTGVNEAATPDPTDVASYMNAVAEDGGASDAESEKSSKKSKGKNSKSRSTPPAVPGEDEKKK